MTWYAITGLLILVNAQDHERYMQLMVSAGPKPDSIRSIDWFNSEMDYPGSFNSVPKTSSINHGLLQVQKLTTTAGFTPVLDSVYETKSLGYSDEWRIWYYEYDDQYRQKSSKRLFYNAYNEFLHITEIRNYDNAGRLNRLSRYQYDTWRLLVFGDTMLIESYTEEYRYENEKLIYKSVYDAGLSNGPGDNTEEFYTYNEQGHLIRITYSIDGYIWNRDYFYDEDDRLQYEIRIASDIFYFISKYEYEIADTTKKTTHYQTTYYEQYDKPIYDTITHWEFIERYHETFDSLGRRTSLTRSGTTVTQDLDWIDYRADYTYTERNDLLHASYYSWEGDAGSGEWREMLRIDNVYDVDGTILLYEKSYYDDRTNQWLTDESMTYYYHDVSSILTLSENSTDGTGIFPNPATDRITLPFQSGSNGLYFIYSLNGKLVQTGSLSTAQIPVSSLDPGLFILKSIAGTETFTGRFIKQ
jgi:hypothetical protein